MIKEEGKEKITDINCLIVLRIDIERKRIWAETMQRGSAQGNGIPVGLPFFFAWCGFCGGKCRWDRWIDMEAGLVLRVVLFK